MGNSDHGTPYTCTASRVDSRKPKAGGRGGEGGEGADRGSIRERRPRPAQQRGQLAQGQEVCRAVTRVWGVPTYLRGLSESTLSAS